MPLIAKEYRTLARNVRNLAREASDEMTRGKLIALAEDYERKAKIRESSLGAANERIDRSED